MNISITRTSSGLEYNFEIQEGSIHKVVLEDLSKHGEMIECLFEDDKELKQIVLTYED